NRLVKKAHLLVSGSCPQPFGLRSKMPYWHFCRCRASSSTPTCLEHAYVADEALRLAAEPF
ncbi:MAG: hypothetical protein ACXVCN_12015, partial [Bdellovibrio sp.]